MTVEERQRECGVLDFPSTEIDEVLLEDRGGGVRIRFTHEAQDDRYVEGGVEFDWVRAYRCRAESHCTVWHLEAYDRVMEVENSRWVAELREAMPPDMRGHFEMHHFMIYLDSAGCYEVVAASWQFLPEVPVERG